MLALKQNVAALNVSDCLFESDGTEQQAQLVHFDFVIAYDVHSAEQCDKDRHGKFQLYPVNLDTK